MRFYAFSEAPQRGSDTVFRESVLRAVVGLFVTLAIVAFPLALAVMQRSVGLALLAAFAGLFPLVAAASLRKSLGRDNWLMRVGADRIVIKFRSYLNAHDTAESPTVVELSAGEIAWVGLIRERERTERSSRKTQVRSRTYLDIGLQNVDVDALAVRLAEERQRPPVGEGRLKTKWGHHPVRLVDRVVLRIEWRSDKTCLTPGIRTALGLLKRFAPVREERRVEADLTAREWKRNVPVSGEADPKIRELAERGDVIGAMTLARRAYGLSLAEARQYVGDVTAAKPQGTERSRDGA